MTKTFEERCKMFEQCLPDASYRDLLKELHAEMLAKLAEQPAQPTTDTVMQAFTGLPKRKLDMLMSADWRINGVSIEHEEAGVIKRGAVTFGGMVLWWNAPQAQP